MTPQTPAYGPLSSSVNPQELSATAQAVARTIAGLLLFFGFLTAADSTTLLSHVNQIITDLIVLVPLAFSMWNSAEAVFGLLRKAMVALIKAKKVSPIAVTQPVI